MTFYDITINAIGSIGFTYFLTQKKGLYPDVLNFLLEKLANKLPDKTLFVAPEFDIETGEYKKTQEVSIRWWFNFLIKCEYCICFWVSFFFGLYQGFGWYSLPLGLGVSFFWFKYILGYGD